MVQDLLLNLFSEFVGIIATVFVIDLILKRREERRWIPSKQSLYGKLFKLTYDIISYIVPFDIKEPSRFLYSFGEAQIFPSVDINSDMLKLGRMNDIHAELTSSKKFDTEPLIKYRDKLGELLEKWAFLIEPEHLTKLLELEQSLDIALQTRANFDDSASISDYAFVLSEVVVFASNHGLWLVKKADKITTFDEFRKSIQEAHDRLVKK